MQHAGTVLVGLALHGAATALVVRITNESRGTGALVRPPRVPATGSGSARSIAAKVDDIATYARISAEAGLAVAHLLVVLRGAESVLAARLSDEAGNLAHVVVTALVIGAIVVGRALDLPASRPGVTEESLLADTIGGMGTGHALGIPAAGGATQAHGLTPGPSVGIAQAGLVLATIAVRLALQLLGANVVRAELELGAGGVRLACSLTDALQAQLFRNAIAVGAAQGTADAVGADASLGTLLVLLAVLQRHTAQLGISGASRLTRADSDVVLHRAAGLSSTGIRQRAGVDALRVQAGLVPGAVVVVRALDVHTLDGGISAGIDGTSADGLMGLSLAVGVQSAGILALAGTAAPGVLAAGRDRAVRIAETLAGIAAAGLQRISNQALGALTVVASRQVVAEGGAVAGLGQALVYILADSIRDQLVTLVAGTHGLVVLHMAVTLTATGQVAGLDAAIGFRVAGTIAGTVLVIDALDLEAAHSGVVGISQVSAGTAAQGLVSLRLAKGIGSANGMSAGIRALAMDAGLVIGAILGLVAQPGLGAALLLSIAVADSSLGADAAIGSGDVLAHGAGMAGFLRAFVNVRAAEGVPMKPVAHLHLPVRHSSVGGQSASDSHPGWQVLSELQISPAKQLLLV